MKNLFFIPILFIALLMTLKVIPRATAETAVELELHNIFNKKLIAPLKLGTTKSEELLEKLNNLSKEMLRTEDLLRENLQALKLELKKKNKINREKLITLNEERIALFEKLGSYEKKKIEEIKTFLTPKKLSYYFVLKESNQC